MMAVLIPGRRRARARVPRPHGMPLDQCGHNGRAMVEELLLIELHLGVTGWWCSRCIKKHLITVAALGSEGARLTGSPLERRRLGNVALVARSWVRFFQRAPDQTLQAVRGTRQAMLRRYYG